MFLVQYNLDLPLSVVGSVVELPVTTADDAVLALGAFKSACAGSRFATLYSQATGEWLVQMIGPSTYAVRCKPAKGINGAKVQDTLTAQDVLSALGSLGGGPNPQG